MKEKYSYLSKNILLFSLQSVVPKILAFILIPIYTYYLSTDQYGTVDLINTTVELLIPIATLTIYDAVLRFGMNKEYSQKQVLTIGMMFALFGTLLVVIGVFLCARLKIFDLNNSYYIILVALFFTNAMDNIVTRFCRVIDKIGLIVFSGILNSLIMFSLNILFLVGFQWGVDGYMLAILIGRGASLLLCFFGAKLYRFLTFKLSKKTFKKMIAFSFPMIFSAIAWWINNASDRYILTWICGVSVSGIFAISNKIPNLLASVQNIFSQAWSISAIKEFDKKDSEDFITNIYTALQFVIFFCVSVLMIVNYPLAGLLYANDFFIAWQYVPPLLMANCFNALSLYIDGLFVAMNDTKIISIATILGAVLNTVCNFILIYFFGAYGAAIATLIGFGAGYLFRCIIFKKRIEVKVNRKREILALLLLCFQLGISWLRWTSLYFQIPALLVLILLYIKEIKNVINLIKNKLQKNKIGKE